MNTDKIMYDGREVTKIMQEMAEKCRYVGASCTKKYFGVYLKCTLTSKGIRWFAEGHRVSEAQMIKMTALNEGQ